MWKSLAAPPLAVAERYFSAAEAAQLRALTSDAQPRRFLQLWTLKEAYLKAIGTGLAGGLGRMSFMFESAESFASSAPTMRTRHVGNFTSSKSARNTCSRSPYWRAVSIPRSR